MLISENPLITKSGSYQGSFAVLTDISERKQLMNDLEHNLIFDNIIAQISAKFINMPLRMVNDGIIFAIRTVAEFLHADRATVGFFTKKNKKINIGYEWIKDGLSPLFDEDNIPDISQLRWIFQDILSGKIVKIQHIEDLHADAMWIKSFLMENEVESILALPVTRRGEIVGILGFLSSSPQVAFSDDILVMVKLVADIISSALEKRNTDEKLRESEEKYRIMMENAADLVSLLDEDMNHEYINQNQLKVLGYSNEEMIGKPAIKFIHPDDIEEGMSLFMKGLKKGHGVGEFRLRHKDGYYIWFEIKGQTFTSRQGKLKALLISRNISERVEFNKRMMEINDELELKVQARAKELQDAQERLIRTEKLAALGKLSGSVGHELRNPLSAIKNSIYYLKMKLNATNGKINKHLDIIDQQINRSQKIISDLLDFSKIKKLNFIKTDLNIIIKDSIKFEAIPENITLYLDLSPDLPAISVDPMQIEQVLKNLLSNAIGAISEKGNLEVLSRVLSDGVGIIIKDTGIGIPADKLDLIFETI